ncbi:MAG: SDR family oxidoreductase [Acidobacteria bacterium]|nr:SDR family oxidoreductase [Acidobacteriota bacterium]
MILAEKTALVTGGSRGIGRAIALELARRGADVVVNFVRHAEAARSVCAEIEKLDRRALAFCANVGALEEIQRLARATVEFGAGGLDFLIHSAALGPFKPLTTLRRNQFELAMNVNTWSLLHLAQHLAPSMARRNARIIALTSKGSQRALPNYGAIGISKAALESLVRYLAASLAADGIRVNAVSPGLVDTDTIRSLPIYEEIKEFAARTPLGRLGRPEDVATCVAMLCGPDADWITGQIIVADGGLGIL